MVSLWRTAEVEALDAWEERQKQIQEEDAKREAERQRSLVAAERERRRDFEKRVRKHLLVRDMRDFLATLPPSEDYHQLLWRAWAEKYVDRLASDMTDIPAQYLLRLRHSGVEQAVDLPIEPAPPSEPRHAPSEYPSPYHGIPESVFWAALRNQRK